MLLIDADITCFSSCASAQEEIEWDEDTWSYYFDFAKGKKRFQDWLDKVIDQAEELVGIRKFTLCYTGKENFRKVLNPTYKGNRGKKPVGYGTLKQWSQEVFPFFEKPQLEADDVMGILATKYGFIPTTMDKDLFTIPGQMVHLDQKLNAKLVESDEKSGNRQFLMQALMGDATDGYGGCPGIGPKTAEKLLDKHGAVWKTVVDAYLKAGLTEEDALMNARMARILRAEDWDFENNEVKLWTP